MIDATDMQNNSLPQRAAWGAVLTAVTVLSTLYLACATPFAALATMAAIFLPRRDALVLIGVNWLANQAIGFGLLHYPLTWSCFQGGINLGIAGMASVGAAMITYRPLRKVGSALSVVGAFAAAFVAYEGALYLSAMGRFEGDFSVPITLYILYINGLALAGLLALQLLAGATGLVASHAKPGARVARAS